MTDPRDEISRIIESAQQQAYERGWNDAIIAMIESATDMKCAREIAALGTPSTDAAIATATGDNGKVKQANPRRTGRPSTKAIQIVEECIVATPGMKGVEVVKAAQSVDASIKERTVRTCLRRLRLSKVIWKRNGLWYPKTKEEKTLFESANGEANLSPPH